MPNLLVTAAIVLIPLNAFAQDAPVPAPVQGPLVEITINNAPGSTPPLAPAAPAPAQPELEADPCAWKWATHTRHRRGHLAFGIAKGHVELDDDSKGKQFSFVARATGRREFGVELEFARTNLGEDESARSAGGALFKAFGKRKLAPYIIAGAGGGIIEAADGSEQRMRYAEAGGGLMLRKRRIAIGIDVRRGMRRLHTDETSTVAEPLMDTAAATITTPDGDRQRYVRGRIMALVQF